MKQATAIQIGNSLLNHAISTLSPEVFSHPVWVRFAQKAAFSSPGTIEDLLSVARNLENDEPGTACQVLLIAAVYLNCGGLHYKALQTARQARALAERTSLVKETSWAIWGACAMSLQQGDYDQATNSLVDLQAVLNEHNEWILAGFVDVIRRSLSHPGTVSAGNRSGSSPGEAFRDSLTFIFNWLQHWGFSTEPSEPELDVISRDPINGVTELSTMTQSFFSIQRLQGRWHTLMLAIRGELRLQWAENHAAPTTRRFTFWGSILHSLQIHLSGRRVDTQNIDTVHQTPSISVLPPATESSPPKTIQRKKKPVSKIKKVSKNQRAQQAITVVPVAVHMLGTFSMTIGDLTVKLPATRSLSVLKYLLLHHGQKISREVLMDVFWPDAEPETARNNLNVAMHSLRKALREVIFLPVIVFEDGSYGLESNLQVWLDIEEFERSVKAGQRLEARDQMTAAMHEYETAASLYQGDFLEQNPYEEWTILDRERLRVSYLDTLDRLSQIYFNQERYAACIAVCQLSLKNDHCNEDAHCLLMRCYSHQGQHHLAIRQYQICIEALHAEMDVEPALETTRLYEQIRRRENILHKKNN